MIGPELAPCLDIIALLIFADQSASFQFLKMMKSAWLEELADAAHVRDRLYQAMREKTPHRE